MHRIEKDYEPRNWKTYKIRLCETDQRPSISDLDCDKGICVSAYSVWIADDAEWIVCSVGSGIFSAACKKSDAQPEWKPEFLFYDYELIAADAITDGGHYAPLDIGFLTQEWRGHKPGALAMKFPTHLGSELSTDEQGFTWMVEVIE